MASTQFTPEQTAHNVETAKQALAHNDLAHALYHISSALCTNPQQPEWRAMLDDVIRRAPEPLVLARMEDQKADYITLATRGYVLATLGRYEDAIDAVTDALLASPDAAFLQWVQEWMRRQGVAQTVSYERFMEIALKPIIQLAAQIPSPMADDDPRKDNLVAAADILAVARYYHPKRSLLLFGSSIVLRRLGQFNDAIGFATESYQLQPDFKGMIGLACAYRDGGYVDHAVQAYRQAMQFDPDDVSPLLDIGDTYLKVSRWDDAIGAYREVLAKEAEHPWASASLAFATYKKSGDVADKKKLFALTEKSGRAWALYSDLAPIEPYVHHHPGSGDATARGIRGVIEHIAQDPSAASGGKVGLKVTHPESPSVLNAFRLWTAQRKLSVAIDLTVEKVQQPDPRVPKSRVDFVLWAYDGMLARPNVAPPDPRVSSAIAQIAKEPFNLEFWEPQAKALGAQMGPAWLEQLLCALVNPPPLPDDERDPLEWVQLTQIATALTIAYVDGGWEGSARKRGLVNVALGPVDWAVDAAIIAMGWLARTDPAVRQDVTQLFAFLEQQVPKEGFTSYEYPLACTWLAMGGHDEATKTRLSAWREAIETRREEEQPETHEGLTLERYAELAVKRDAIIGGGNLGVAGGMAAMQGGGTRPALETLCREYRIEPRAGAAAGRVPGWDERINADRAVQDEFFRLQNNARLKAQGIDPGSHEGRVAEMLRRGVVDVEAQKVNAQAAAQQMAQGQGGEPDPVVFPGQRLERLSQYVGLMKGMQTGDMNGALARAGLDMGSYMQVAQAWGVKLASDPVLTAKFSKMMAG